MKLGTLFCIATLALAGGAVAGCTVHAETPAADAYVYSEPVPEDLSMYPQTDWDGRHVYYYRDRWIYRDRDHWAYLHHEPDELRHHRHAYGQAPPAYAPPAYGQQPYGHPYGYGGGPPPSSYPPPAFQGPR